MDFIRHDHLSILILFAHNLQFSTRCSKVAKCSFLQAALNAAKQTKDGRDGEIAALRSELEVIMFRSRQFSPYEIIHQFLV